MDLKHLGQNNKHHQLEIPKGREKAIGQNKSGKDQLSIKYKQSECHGHTLQESPKTEYDEL